MDADQFRQFGKAMIDYIADYQETIRDRKVLPSVEPGYLQHLLPDEAPQKGEPWQEILKDVDRIIMPGVTHWQSPNFHAYYPTACSYPSIVGDMLSGAIACVGFSWMAGPACTELEVAMMNWLGKLLHLPEEFLNCSEGPGGGVIQGSASEASLVALLAAKDKFVRSIREKDPTIPAAEIKGKLVAYSSDQSNSSVEKAGLIGSMMMRLLPSDEDGALRGTTLQEAVRKDREAGLIPCFFIASLGTTGTCAFDNLEEIGPICQEEGIWLHIDAAYAGTVFICPEYRYLMKGVEYSDSFNFNTHKWMLCNFDCSCMWVKDARYLMDAFNVDRIYLKHNKTSHLPDYRHWQIPLGRRFRALKLWFVLRSYGVEGIQEHVRKDIALAKYFESLVKQDERFEACTLSLGLATFRLKGDDSLTQKLLDKITADKTLYLIPCYYRERLVARFVIASRMTQKSDVDFAWSVICEHADQIVAPKIKKMESVIGDKYKFDAIKITTNTECLEKSK
ncbi:Pyridoxal-dependent decarboxylase conserved domain [Popillia japonica]|uniref:Pyridoxal-dependent decarboxylase conserved domain n=1 Tax=Popillia japonica TaxID=7064 RepID=A0AAW1K391_POPJA